MKVMSRAFRRNSHGTFHVNVPPTKEPMFLGWLPPLEIPSKAKTLWLELLDVPTKHSIPVMVEKCVGVSSLTAEDEIFIQGRKDFSCLYRDEFARNGFEQIVKFLGSNDKVRMHVQVYYRT